MSILRRLSHPFAAFEPTSRRRSNSTTADQDLPGTTKDSIFVWQIGSLSFHRIGAETLLRSHIVDTKTYAAKVLSGAEKCGVISPATGQPNTAKINRELGKSLPMISVPKQKELVMLLFFWEEEIVRWDLLSVEEEELKARLEVGDQEAEEELRFVQMKKRLRPSLRDQSGRVTVEQGGGEVLPSYEEVRRERYS